MTVDDLLRLAPFSLGTITILLAAGGLIFSHAYSRYGDDAAISFLLRMRFLLGVVLVAVVPVLMLVSVGRQEVPDWVTSEVAAGVVGAGMLVSILIVGYLLFAVSRPHTFLSSVGKRVKVARLNRHSLAVRWQEDEEFDSDMATRRYQWFNELGRVGAPQERTRLRRAGWTAVRVWMGIWRATILRFCRSDPSEVLFGAAAAGLRNGNMRTWRSALRVIGRQLRDESLKPAAAEILVTNGKSLEEFAHLQGSEDCKESLCLALGEISSTAMRDERAAESLARGISALAERRLREHRPVTAAVEALGMTAVGNPVPTVKAIGWLGQHLVSIPPPSAVYGLDGDHIEPPARALFSLLVDLARRADDEGDAGLNATVIDTCRTIAGRLPGAQDHETIGTLGYAGGLAGVAAAKRYGKGEDWYGTNEAVEGLVRVHEVMVENGSAGAGQEFVEMITRIGSWAVPNDESVRFWQTNGRSDMAGLVAGKLLELPAQSVELALMNLRLMQVNSGITMEMREEFIGICQEMSGQLLGFQTMFGSEAGRRRAADDQSNR